MNSEWMEWVIDQARTFKTRNQKPPIQLWTDGWNSIHSEPMHPNVTEWRKPQKPIGNPPLCVNVNLNAKDCRDGAIRLLKKCDVDPLKVCLMPGE